MDAEWTIIGETHSPEETKELAAALATLARPGLVVALDGDLGAGKTQFAQGLAAGLGIAQPVSSPTFSLMAAYEDGLLPLCHFDLYRLDDPEQLEDIGFFEFVEGEGIACIEWASKFKAELPDDRLEVFLAGDPSSNERVLRACATGPTSQDVLIAWAARLG